jgi:hypothetical protein
VNSSHDSSMMTIGSKLSTTTLFCSSSCSFTWQTDTFDVFKVVFVSK